MTPLNRNACWPIIVQFCLDPPTGAEQRALEDDLSLAARIQRALLPISV